MTLSLSSAIVCRLDVQGRQVHLNVRQEGDDVWRWSVLMGDLSLEQGAVTSRIAAQVEAQRAFEYRLSRAGVSDLTFTGYRWDKLIGSSTIPIP